MGEWLETPAGRVLLAWEQARIDRAVADVFGYHALQFGLPQVEGLRANRMPHRWLASDRPDAPPRAPIAPACDPAIGTAPLKSAVALHCDAEALPFPSDSLDLVVLPHTLELAQDPHLALSEAARVLTPGGRVVVTGFNPASLWALRQRLGRTARGLGMGGGRLFLPEGGEAIGYWRLRDWLHLLSFDIEIGRFGCWRPPWNSAKWLDRFGWMEPFGERWLPVLGAVYVLVAVRRVRGMRLVGRVKRARMSTASAPAVASHRRRP